MQKHRIKSAVLITGLLISAVAFSQQENNSGEEIITKTISIDSLKKIRFLEDLLDSFPKNEYYIYYCYITRSGKGFVTTSMAVENDVKRNNPNSHLRCEIIPLLFDVPDRPVKPGQKYLFDRIRIRKFNDKNSSEPFPSLELYITN